MDYARQKSLDKQLRKAAGKGDVAAIAQLLDAGADINARSGFFTQTPLAAAARHEKLAAVTLLLDRGADIELPDSINDNPLSLAVSYGYEPIARVLVARGADVEHRGSNKKTPLETAQQQKNAAMIDLLSRALEDKRERERQEAARREAARLKAQQEQEAREKAAAEAERIKERDTVTFTGKIGDRTLEEVYDMNRRERITLVRRADGAVEAVTRESFSAIDDKSAIRRAFEACAAKGSPVKESDIFPDMLPKLKRPQGGP